METTISYVKLKQKRYPFVLGQDTRILAGRLSAKLETAYFAFISNLT